MEIRRGTRMAKKLRWVLLRVVLLLVLALFGLGYLALYQQDVKTVNDKRFIPLRLWIHWGAAAPRMASLDRNFFLLSQGDL